MEFRNNFKSLLKELISFYRHFCEESNKYKLALQADTGFGHQNSCKCTNFRLTDILCSGIYVHNKIHKFNCPETSESVVFKVGGSRWNWSCITGSHKLPEKILHHHYHHLATTTNPNIMLDSSTVYHILLMFLLENR